MKKSNKIVAGIIGLLVISGSMYAASVPVEQPVEPKASVTKLNVAKMAKAVIKSVKAIMNIVADIVQISSLKDNQNYNKAIYEMQPANLYNVLQKPDAEMTKDLSEAFNNFRTVAPLIVKPATDIVDNLIKIIKSFGEAIVNPDAEIRGKPALETFENGVTTLSQILKATRTLSIILSKLPNPTNQQMQDAAKKIATGVPPTTK